MKATVPAQMTRARWMVAGLALAALTACGDAPEGVTAGMVSDPYADMPDGGARYIGVMGPAGTTGALAGSATPQGFSATGDTVLFPADQVALSAEGRGIVQAQAQWLIRNRGFTAVIQGHSDEEGTREYNLALGARRAAAVQEYLIASGVEAGRLSTVSYGRERPLAVCQGDEACMARNRRVTTVVQPGAGA